MDRKLTNTLSALATTGAVLVATVVFGLDPLVSERYTEGVERGIDATRPPPAIVDTAAEPVSRASNGGVPQFRRTHLMPYFSLVPRG